jgi:transposase InsO family protein
VVLDLFSRKVVGWSLGDTLATSLVTEALHDAARCRRLCEGAIHLRTAAASTPAMTISKRWAPCGCGRA